MRKCYCFCYETKAINSSDNGEDIKMIIIGNTVYNNWNQYIYMTAKIPPNGNPEWKNSNGLFNNFGWSRIICDTMMMITMEHFFLKITYVLIMEKMELILTDQMVVQL